MSTALPTIESFDDRTYQYVTSLSYDLVDSTQLAKQLGDEQYMNLLSAVHSTFQVIVSKYHGISDVPHSNDGCMSYFGALGTHDAAKRMALQAALEIRDEAVSKHWDVRIGMSYGLVAVLKHQPGSWLVNSAGTLQKMAANHQIRVSPALAFATRTWYDYVPAVSDVAVNSLKGGAQNYVLIGRREEVQQSQATDAMPYLFGRQQTLRSLRDVWQGVKKGAGAAVEVAGEAGIGKSALINSFVAMLSKKDQHETLFLRGYPESQQQAFAPLVPVVTAWSAQPLTQDEAWAAGLLTSTQTKNTDVSSQHVDSATSIESQLIRVLVQKLYRIASAQSLVLVVEDCHWLDLPTIRLLTQLVRGCASYPLMLIMTTRQPDVLLIPEDELGSVIHKYRLKGLTFDESAALIESARGERSLSEAQIDRFIMQSQGVPLFLQESMRMLLDTDSLVRDDRGNRFEVPVSDSIEEILLYRIEASGDSKDIIKIASVMTSTIDIDMLVRAAMIFDPLLLENRILAHLEKLEITGILQTVGESDGRLIYTFSHELLQRTAYKSVWQEHLVRIHGIFADLMMAKSPAKLEAAPSVVAQHLVGAYRRSEALPYMLLAGRLNKKKGAHSIAIMDYEACLSILDHLPAEQAHWAMALEARLQLAGQVLLTYGYGDLRVGECYSHTLRLGQTAKDEHIIFKSHIGLHAYYLMRGEFTHAQLQIDQARSSPLVQTQALPVLLCDFAQAMLLFYRGDLQTCDALMAQCEDTADQLRLADNLSHNPNVLSAMYHAYCLWVQGLTEQAVINGELGVNKSRNLQTRLPLVQALGIQSMLLFCRGDYLSASICAKAAIDTGHGGEYALWLDLAVFIAAAAQVHLSHQVQKPLHELKAALDKMTQAHASWAAKTAVLTQPFYLCTLAQCHMLLKDYEMAKHYLDQAIELVERYGERYYASEVLRTLAELTLKWCHQSDWVANAQTLLNTAYEDAKARGLHSLALRVALTMHDWELAANQTGLWLGHGISTRDLLIQSLTSLEPHATTQDAMRCRQLLAQSVESV